FVMTGETRAAAEDRKSPLEALRVARPLLRDLRYVVALAATFVGWWTISGPAGTVGVVFADEKLGFDAGQIGFGVTLLAVGEILDLFIAGRAADLKGRRAVLVPSLAAAAVATALLGQIADASWAYYPLMVAIGASIAAGGAAAGGLLADSIPRSGSGAAVGVNQMAGDLGYLTAPTIIGSVAEKSSFGAAYLVGALPAAAVFLAALRLPGGRPAAPSIPPAEPQQPVA
ncbi:MAG: MFS transporter, partial [Actinomycetota bacterium]|nr:MFS transporter [Actinomycetota bacterium]